MISEREINERHHLSRHIGIAMTVACAVYIGSSPPTGGVIWFPLSGWLAEIYSTGIFDALKMLLLAFLVVRGPTVGVLGLGSVLVLLIWAAKYSGMGAFIPIAAYNLAFFATVASYFKGESPSDIAKDQKNIGKAAAMSLAIIFIGAALQKINSNYLAGFEFFSRFGFLGPLIQYADVNLGPQAGRFLAWSSIAVELGIGFGALWWPRLAAHFAVIFCLVLTLVHPAVLFVYFTFCPFLLLIDSNVVARIKGERFRSLLSNEFLWITVLLLGVVSFDWMKTGPSAFFIRPWIVTVALLSVHGWLLKQAVGETRGSDWVFTDWRPKAATAVLLLVLAATPVAAWLGAPAPVGFTMFSGRGKEMAPYQIRLKDMALCGQVSANVRMYSSTDGRFSWNSESFCSITGPTKSGMDFVLKQLCTGYEIPYGGLETRTTREGAWVEYDCRGSD